jgi:CubicO group peptidase (beta-lactamase class C family)
MPRIALRLLALALLAIALPLQAQKKARPATPPAGVPPGLDQYVDSVMKAFGVPGISLTIVKDGKVVVARGYGVRRLGDPTPVDAGTLFGIASNTKVFTSLALGLLVEQGKIQWDAPVVTYLPWFQMYDSWVTREITVRDLLVHRSGLGLGAGDLLWWPASDYSRAQIARQLKFIKPATSFRYSYAYDNVLYVVAGELIEAVSGQTWEEFVRTNILEPAGMSTSFSHYPTPDQRNNIASPHAVVEGTLKPVWPDTSAATNPAGGIMTNAQDEAKWLMIMADSGKMADGKALYSTRTARALWMPVTILNNNPPPPQLAPLKANFRGYALGLNMSDYRGYKVAEHTGGLPGFVSEVTTVPDLRLGVAVFTNAESGPAFRAITLHVLDYYMGAKFDWLGAWKWVQARNDSANAATMKASASARNAESKPSLPLSKYAGTYRDPWYGDVAITDDNGQLMIRFTHSPVLVGKLEHWQYDTFVARWTDREVRADAYVTFTLDPDGNVASVKMLPASPDVDFSFDFQDLDLKPVKP